MLQLAEYESLIKNTPTSSFDPMSADDVPRGNSKQIFSGDNEKEW